MEQASKYLEQAAATNIVEFIKTLSDILRHGGNSPVARMAAGLQLKNQLTSKDPTIKQLCQQRWLTAPEDIRTYIKKNVSVSYIFKESEMFHFVLLKNKNLFYA